MDRRVRQVLALLATPPAIVRVRDLAAAVGVGPSRLRHLFKREIRMSIRAFIRERRLAEAVRLLVSTSKPVSAISFEAGFPDISNFNHLFKKRFGLSPTGYRRRSACSMEVVLPVRCET